MPINSLKDLKNSQPFIAHSVINLKYCQNPVLGLGLEVDFTFTQDNKNNDNHNNNDKNNPHLNLLRGTELGDKEQRLEIRDKT